MAVKFTSAVTVATLALLATSALAQAVYRYKDSQGNTVYTDTPPAGKRAASFRTGTVRDATLAGSTFSVARRSSSMCRRRRRALTRRSPGATHCADPLP